VTGPLGHAWGGTLGLPQPPCSLQTVPPLPPPATHRQATPIRLPALIGDKKQLRHRALDVHVIALLDCSGSEYCATGDIHGYRMASMRTLARLMTTSGGGTFDLIHWGSRPHHTYGPANLTTDHKHLDRALQHDPGSMGGNDFPAALTLAAHIRTRGTLHQTPLIIGVTDGLEPITPAMHTAVTNLPPGSVHVLLVPGDNCPNDLAAQWQALPLGSFTRLPNDNHTLAHTIGTLYANAIGATLPSNEATRAPRRTSRRIRGPWHASRR
jgi:hypothetical protein